MNDIETADMAVRHYRFLTLASKYGIDEDCEHSAGEDFIEIEQEYALSGRVERYATVTSGGEWFYLKTWSDFQNAAAAASENMADDLFAEAPVEIIDLETGKQFLPVVIWKEAGEE